MKKVILIGKTDDCFTALNERLSRHYRVRFGSSVPIAIFGILESFKPDLAVIRLSETDSSVTERLRTMHPEIHICAVGTQSEADGFAELSGCTVCANDPDAIYDAVVQSLPVSEDEDETLKTVMVVDDDASMVRMVKAMIEDEFGIMAATSGAKALKLLEKKLPDVILLDYEMPEMNGVQTLERLRANGNTADIPVIFLTGTKNEAVMDAVAGYGAAGYLIKPADTSSIKESIRKAAAAKG